MTFRLTRCCRRRRVGGKSSLQFGDSSQDLKCSVHVACIAKIVHADWEGELSSRYMHSEKTEDFACI